MIRLGMASVILLCLFCLPDDFNSDTHNTLRPLQDNRSVQPSKPVQDKGKKPPKPLACYLLDGIGGRLLDGKGGYLTC